MIFDRVENWSLYGGGQMWKKAFEFITSLSVDTADGRYELMGDAMFARVMSYETKTPADAALETHRKYIDIQTVISGAEGIECFPAAGLSVNSPYNEGKDVEFYVRPGAAPARLDLFPGTFGVFYPGDAHMPALQVGGRKELIRKAVVKIKVDA